MYTITVWLAIAVLLSYHAQAERRRFGSGYAFPPASQNDAINALRTVNPAIDWDRTSFLSNTASQFAECNNLGRSYSLIDEQTSNGQNIGLVIDSGYSRGSDTSSVSLDIKGIINKWTSTGQYNKVIRDADTFGCSVRPACSGNVIVACLFSPAQGSVPPPPPPPPEKCHEYGKAMSQSLYRFVESVTGADWDRTLENIAGLDISCDMTSDWPFTCAKNTAAGNGKHITGVSGVGIKRGSTENTAKDIISRMRKVYGLGRVGCSFIPDCPGNQVVVSCLYEVQSYYLRSLDDLDEVFQY